MRQTHGSVAGRLVAVSLSIVLAVMAINFAVHLIMRIWVPLIIILGVAVIIAGAAGWYRRRAYRW